jgi:hypothetical protein
VVVLIGPLLLGRSDAGDAAAPAIDLEHDHGCFVAQAGWRVGAWAGCAVSQSPARVLLSLCSANPLGTSPAPRLMDLDVEHILVLGRNS